MEMIIKLNEDGTYKFIMNEKNITETNEKVIEEPVIKRGRGRPRVHPMKDPNAPRRPVGRPRKFNCLS
jgi:hypothetical protein